MKKFMITALMSLALSPLSGLAEGACGMPPATKEQSFCKCFIDEAHRVCREEAHQPPAICTRAHAAFIGVPGKNFIEFCTKYKKLKMIPAEVSIEECAIDLAYYDVNCR